MTRPIKIILKILGVLAGIGIILWLAVAAYVNTHKKEVLESITVQLNENITGILRIGSMEPALVQGFPGISVSLKNVLLRDSLYETHKHDLLKAKEIYIDVNIFSVLSGSPRIRNISIRNADIYLFTDSLGYSNTRLFKNVASDGGNKKSGSSRKINSIELKNVGLSFENKAKGKLFNFSIKDLSAKLKYHSDTWNANVILNTHVNNLIFNTKKGSFIKGKQLQTKLGISYTYASHTLTIPMQSFKFDSDELNIGGSFSFGPGSSAFRLNIKANKLPFRSAASLLPPNIADKLKSYDLKNPIMVEANIKGALKGKTIPLINVNWEVKDNTLTVNKETIYNSSFTGSFTNQLRKGKPRTDPNSAISFYNVKGTWAGITFNSDTANVFDLKQPVFQGKFYSDFPLKQLNSISGSETFTISKGRANLNVLYKAPLNPDAPVTPYIYGSIKVNSAEILYKPRNLTFKQVSGAIEFSGTDLLVKKMSIQSGSTKMVMNGSVNNFVNLYYSDPKKIILDWKIESRQINLGEFLAFLAKRKPDVQVVKGKNASKIFRQLDQVLAQSSAHIHLISESLKYRKFVAKNVNANIMLTQSGITIRDISLTHAGGGLSVKGAIDQTKALNQFNIHTTINKVDIQKLFYAFEDFGQQAISYKNITGTFYSTTKISGSLRDNGQIVPRSLHGSVSFDLRDGALKDFGPIAKIGNFAFPKRDFSNITFKNLKNTLDIKGSHIYIRPMRIESSVLNLFIEGVYGMSKGTDITLQVPLRNPEKDKLLPDSLKEKRIKRGIVLNLRAVDGDDGNVKIKLGKGDDKEKK